MGRSLAGAQTGGGKNSDIDGSGKALVALEAIGGAARVEKENDGLVICSESCPLATAVAEHPEVCRLAEAHSVRSDWVGGSRHCDRKGPPRCRFEVIGS